MNALVSGLVCAVVFTIGFFIGRVSYIKYHVNKPEDKTQKKDGTSD